MDNWKQIGDVSKKLIEEIRKNTDDKKSDKQWLDERKR